MDIYKYVKILKRKIHTNTNMVRKDSVLIKIKSSYFCSNQVCTKHLNKNVAEQ